MDLEARLASVEAAAGDAVADLSTDLGGHAETTTARLWRGQVLVDWEPDTTAGDCLLRPALLRRLIALHGKVDNVAAGVRITAPGRIVASLSPEHADLVARLGGARRVDLDLFLRFDGLRYSGGAEVYFLVERGQRVPLLRLIANVRAPLTHADGGLPRTSPAPS